VKYQLLNTVNNCISEIRHISLTLEDGNNYTLSAANNPYYNPDELSISWKQGDSQFQIQCPILASYMDFSQKFKTHLQKDVPESRNIDIILPSISGDNSPRIYSRVSTPSKSVSSPTKVNPSITDAVEEELVIPPENLPPYSKAIVTLRNIIKERSPRDKLGCILNTFRETIKCVTDFWDKEGCEPVVGADDLVPIFTFIILKAQIPNLYTEMNFIWEFASDNEMNGNFGYGYATFQVGVEAVARLEEIIDTGSNDKPAARAIKKAGILEKRDNLVTIRRMSRIIGEDDEMEGMMNPGL